MTQTMQDKFWKKQPSPSGLCVDIIDGYGTLICQTFECSNHLADIIANAPETAKERDRLKQQVEHWRHEVGKRSNRIDLLTAQRDDLLAALVELEQLITAHISEECDVWCKNARAAIAKAKGGAA